MSFEALGTDLEAALLRELHAYYDYENRARFGRQLRTPILALSDAESRLGRWVAATRTIELSRRLVATRPWLEITSVLEHEMAHQYVDEVVGAPDETAHGETFRRVCAERGIDAKAAGAPVPHGELSPGAAALDRIRKLLALAGSSNEHEAELAMKRAHELMLRHNIEATRAHEERGYEVRHLGDPERRGTRVEQDIVGILVQFFFVKAIRVPVYLPRLGQRGLVHEICGTPANVEMAAHVYEFLRATADRLWEQNRDDDRIRTGRDRIAYQAGVIEGFRCKLLLERVCLRDELKQERGLVWTGDKQLEAFYRRRHPFIRTTRSRVRLSGAHSAGREAGSKIVLHRPVAGSGNRGRLLGGG